jgi:hypothetical protein
MENLITVAFWSRVAGFYLAQHAETGENVPNDPKIYQMTPKYTK